ncbi:AAA family ATPase [Clostridiaceae bacterium M8S5]|nr:AAA family ATPase [Clostridiaceae bacterium M8S5]
MIISQLNLVSFGKFKNKKINLDKGVNIIYGVNESGKTTIHSFIEGMFYGFFNPNTRTKRYTLKYDKYLPWDNNAYAGVLRYIVNDRVYRVERNFLKGNDEVKIYNDLGEDISYQFTYNKVTRVYEPSSMHLGINNIVYNNTISINQSKSVVSNDLSKHIKEKLINVGQSLDEDISVVNVVKKLEDRLKDIGSVNKSKSQIGRLAKEIKHLEDLEHDLCKREKDIKEYQKQLIEINSLLEQETTEKQQLVNVLEDLKNIDNKRMQLEALTLIKSIEDKEKDIDKLQKFSSISLEDKDVLIRLDDNVQYIKENLSEARKKYNKSLDKLNELNNGISKVLKNNKISKPKKGQKGSKISYAMIISALLAILSIYLAYAKDIVYCWISASALFMVTAVLFIITAILDFKRSKLSNSSNEDDYSDAVKVEITKILKEQIDVEYSRVSSLKEKILKEYENIEFVLNRNNTNNIDEYCKAYEAKNRLIKLEEEVSNQKILLKQLIGDKAIDDIKEVEINIEEIEQFIDKYNREEIEDEISKKDDIINNLRSSQIIINDKIKHKEDNNQFIDIREKLTLKRRKMNKLCHDINAIKLTKNSIENISKNIHNEFMPSLNKMTSDMISNITDGKYKEVKVTENLEVKVVDEHSSKIVDIEDLSGGTIDQFYIAVRLGMIDLLSEKKDTPVFLDDSFVQYDDERLYNILDIIHKISHRKQIILFTCHNREKAYFDKMGLKYNYINVEH